MRSVRGCVADLRTGEPVAMGPGVPGRDDAEGVSEGARFLPRASGLVGADAALEGPSLPLDGVALEMSSFPG